MWMPRSRQISVRTAPMGRLRTCLAICAGVAKRMGLGAGFSAAGVAAARGLCGARTAAGRGSGWGRASRRVSLASRAAARCRPRDAGEDLAEVVAAEGAGDVVEVGGGRWVLERGGELLAVVDDAADEGDDAAEAAGTALGCGAGLGRKIGKVGSGGHEPEENTG